MKEFYYLTAYGIALKNGFKGTEQEWLESLKVRGPGGKSAYEYAKEAGYAGTEEQFALHLAADGKSAYEYAVEAGFTGTEEEFARKLAAVAILKLNGKLPDPDGSFLLTADDLKVLSLSGGTMEGAVKILEPTELENPVTLRYLQENYLKLAGGTMTADIDAGRHTVKNLLNPVNPQDASTKKFTEEASAKAAAEAVNSFRSYKTVSLTAEGWGEDQMQAVAVEGVTADIAACNVLVTPAPESYDAYHASTVRAVEQKEGELVFKWGEEKPGVDLSVNLRIEVQAK